MTGRVRESARASQCASNLRGIGAAALLFANDNKFQLPRPYVATDPLDDPNPNRIRQTWERRMLAQLGARTESEVRKRYVCPSANPQPALANDVTYAMSRFLRTNSINHQLAKIPAPVLLMVDIPTIGWSEILPWNSSGYDFAQRSLMFRHGNKQNGVFTDGHVESMGPERAGAFAGSTPNAWVPAGVPYSQANYTPNPSAPTNALQ